MTPENKNGEDYSNPIKAPRPSGRLRRLGAAVALTGAMLAPGALYDQAPQPVKATAELNPENDPVRLQAKEAFENVMYDDLYRCKVHDIELGEPITTDEYGNNIPLTPILEYSMTVTEGQRSHDFPPRKTADGADVEIGWQRYGSAADVRFEFKDEAPKELPDPHSFRSEKSSDEAEAEGEFDQAVELDPSVDGERTVDLIHSGEVALYDTAAQSKGEKPPSKILQKYCGSVTIMMHDGKATITNVSIKE